MELWEVDLNLDILERYFFFFNAVIRFVDKNNNADTVCLSFKKATLSKLNSFHFFFKMHCEC